jgi:cytochrome c oxidase subunit IV
VGRQVVSVVFVVVMVLVIVGVDVLFFRHHGWERLAVNVGIVLVLVACYARFVPRR